MRGILAGALALGVLALVLALAALVRAPGGDDVGAGLESVRNELGAVRAELAKASSEIGGLQARLRELSSAVAELSERAETAGRGPRGLTPAELPQVVRDAAARAVEGIRLTKARRDVDDNDVVFELRGWVGDRRYELAISAGGEVLEVELPLSQVPEAVSDAVAKTIEGIELTEARRDIDDDRVVFDLEGRLGGETYELRVSAAGEVLEAELPPSQVPQAVKDAAAGAIEGIQLTEAWREADDDEVFYELEGRVGDGRYDLTISAEGEVLEAEIPLDGVPQAVMDAAAGAVEGIRFTEAWRETDDDEVVYGLHGRVGDREYDVTVSPAGQVLDVERVNDEDDEDDEEEEELPLTGPDEPAEEPAGF